MNMLPTLLFIFSGMVLAISHALSLKFFLYWQYPWLDIPIHALGGIFLVLGIFAVYDLRPNFPKRFLLPIPALFFVLLITLAWEVFQLKIGIPIDDNYEVDTILDLIMGMLGGVMGYILGYSFSTLDLNEDIA